MPRVKICIGNRSPAGPKRNSVPTLNLGCEKQPVDVIIALGTTETNVAKEIAPKIPTVFLPAADPVKSGFVRSLASPGTHLTGLSFFMGSENVGKQLEVFKQVIPVA